MSTEVDVIRPCILCGAVVPRSDPEVVDPMRDVVFEALRGVEEQYSEVYDREVTRAIEAQRHRLDGALTILNRVVEVTAERLRQMIGGG